MRISGRRRDARCARKFSRIPLAFYFGALAIACRARARRVWSRRCASPRPANALVGWLVVALLLALLPAADAAVAIVHQLVNLVRSRVATSATRLRARRARARSNRRRRAPPPRQRRRGGGGARAIIEVQYLANRDPQIRFALLSDLLDSPTRACGGRRRDRRGGRRRDSRAERRVRRPRTPTAAPTRRTILRSTCCIGRVDGTPPTTCGWGGNESAESSSSSTRSSAGRPMTRSRSRKATCRGCAASATSSRSTRTPCCRDRRAAALIGTIAHPLNRAEYDPGASAASCEGYGILQPRVSVSLASASESRFAAIYAGHPGLDPYTTAVSDVYQDLFGEGTFTGKGIYDVDVFRRATDGRFPDNTLLSHDLLEGTFARAGLVTDVEVFDDYPTRYLTSTRRMHRWIRGDWQLLRWLTSRVPGAAGSNRDPLSSLSRWKIADNMRRSATPLAQFAWLVAGLTVSSRIAGCMGRRRARRVRRAVDRPAPFRRHSSTARAGVAPVLRGAGARRDRARFSSWVSPSCCFRIRRCSRRTPSRGRSSACSAARRRHARVADGVAHGADDGEQQVVRVAPHVAGGVVGRGDR